MRSSASLWYTPHRRVTATGGIELAAVDGRKTRLKKKDQPCLNNLQKFPETKGGESLLFAKTVTQAWLKLFPSCQPGRREKTPLKNKTKTPSDGVQEYFLIVIGDAVFSR